MIEINNKHIVLMLLILIISVFIYNFDVYVIPKNEPLCKPIFVTKREINSEMITELNKTESEILKETFNNFSENEYFENLNNEESTEYNIPPKSFSSFTITSLTNKHKIKVIDSVIKILSYIPTNYNENQIKQIVEYFAIIYSTSSNLESFYKNILSSTKIKEVPYNSKYSHLILFLIGKIDNDYFNYQNPNLNSNSNLDLDTNSNIDLDTDLQNDKNNMNELLKGIIKKKSKTLNTDNIFDTNEQNIISNNQELSIDYLTEELNEKKINPKKVLNIIEKNKTKKSNGIKESNELNKFEQNIILPKINTQQMKTQHMKTQQINNLSTKINDNNYHEQNSLISQNSKYNKCDDSNCSLNYNTSYLNSELKPLENFDNIYNNYAQI
jgi:hypothetical protein